MLVPSILVLATLLASAHQVRGLGLCLGGADTFGGSQEGGRSLGSCGVGTMVSLLHITVDWPACEASSAASSCGWSVGGWLPEWSLPRLIFIQAGSWHSSS